MLFNYEAIESSSGLKKDGSIDAVNVDAAISSLQRRNLVLVSIKEADGSKSFFGKEIVWFDRISNKDVVILSRQLATLFDAQVSALRVFKLLASETENKKLSSILGIICDDIQSGSSISMALDKHPKVFTPFYVSMVKAGEESGKLDETFLYPSLPPSLAASDTRAESVRISESLSYPSPCHILVPVVSESLSCPSPCHIRVPDISESL